MEKKDLGAQGASSIRRILPRLFQRQQRQGIAVAREEAVAGYHRAGEGRRLPQNDALALARSAGVHRSE